MDRITKVMLSVCFVFLSLILRSIGTICNVPVYLDKVGIILASIVLGGPYAVLVAILIPLFAVFFLQDIIGIFRIFSYVTLAIIAGTVTDVLAERRDIKTRLIEISWFLTVLFGTIVLIMYLTFPLNILLAIIGLIIMLMLLLSTYGKLRKLFDMLRNIYSLVTLFLISLLAYVFTEFSVYIIVFFNFLSPENIEFSFIEYTTLIHIGDALISMLMAFVIYLTALHTGVKLRVMPKRRRIITTAMLMLIIIGILIPSTIAYIRRENIISPGLPDKSPWKLTIVRMDYVWLPIGAHGTNYYHLVPDGRYDPSSKYYQAWFGIYWIDGKWGIRKNQLFEEDIYKFAIIDQNFWLSQHGDPAPYTAIYEEEKPFKRIIVNGVEGWFLKGSMITHSDVAMTGYEEIIISGFFFVAYFEKHDKTAIVYACTYEDYYDDLEQELLSMLYSITWPK